MFVNCHGRCISFNLLALVDDSDVYERVASLLVHHGGAVSNEARDTLDTQTVFLDLLEPGSVEYSHSVADEGGSEVPESEPSGELLPSAQFGSRLVAAGHHSAVDSTEQTEKPLNPAEELKNLLPDTYHYTYVERCVMAGFLIDPRPFRVQRCSVFEHDAAILRVLIDSWTWADLWRWVPTSPEIGAEGERLFLSLDSESPVAGQERCVQSPLLSQADSVVSSYFDAVSTQPPTAAVGGVAADVGGSSGDDIGGSVAPATRGKDAPATRGKDAPATRGSVAPGDRGSDAPRGTVVPGDRGSDAPRGNVVPGDRGSDAPRGNVVLGDRGSDAPRGSVVLGDRGSDAPRGSVVPGDRGSDAPRGSVAPGDRGSNPAPPLGDPPVGDRGSSPAAILADLPASDRVGAASDADGVVRHDDSDDSDDFLLSRAGVSLSEAGGVTMAWGRRRFCRADDWRILRFVANVARQRHCRYTMPYLVTGSRYWREVHGQLPEQLRVHSPLSLWTHFLRELVPRLPVLRRQGDADVVDAVCQLIGAGQKQCSDGGVAVGCLQVADTSIQNSSKSYEGSHTRAISAKSDVASDGAKEVAVTHSSSVCATTSDARARDSSEEGLQLADGRSAMTGVCADMTAQADSDGEDNELEQLRAYISSIHSPADEHAPTQSLTPVRKSALTASRLDRISAKHSSAVPSKRPHRLAVDMSESQGSVVSSSHTDGTNTSPDFTLIVAGSGEFLSSRTRSDSLQTSSDSNDTQVGSTMNDALLVEDDEVSSMVSPGDRAGVAAKFRRMEPSRRRRRLYGGVEDAEILSLSASSGGSPRQSRVSGRSSSTRPPSDQSSSTRPPGDQSSSTRPHSDRSSSSHPVLTRKRPYSASDDDVILDFFEQCPRRVLETRGRAVWEELERQLLGERTWQSLKNRFLRSIVPRIHSYCGRDRKFVEQVAERHKNFMKYS